MTTNLTNKQQKYRKNQSHKGLVRFEIQIEADLKSKFDEIVEAIAQEFILPSDHRQRVAIARRMVFKKILDGVSHDFSALKDEISALQAEIKALSPSFFKPKDDTTPLPQAINTLPDDPIHLKQLLSKLYAESQKTKSDLTESNRRAKQYLELYEAISDENDRLRKYQTIVE